MNASEKIQLIQDSLMKAWQIYIGWYTWFFGINVGVLGWLLSAPHLASKTVVSQIDPISVFMILVSLMSVGAAVVMIRYSGAAQRRIRNLDENFNSFDKAAFGRDIMLCGGAFTLITNSLFVAGWLYLLTGTPLSGAA